MIDHLLRDLQVLHKADLLIGRIWVNVLARRFSLFAFAALIAVFGLGMGNVAGYFALQTSVGSVWAATIVAVADLLIAAIVLLVASNARPGPEIDVALEVRRMALDSVQSDARDLKLMFDALGQEVKNIKTSIADVVQNPLDVAAQKLLIPAALSLLKGFRSKKEHA